MNDEAVRDQMGAALCRVPRVWTGDFGPYEIADALTKPPDGPVR